MFPRVVFCVSLSIFMCITGCSQPEQSVPTDSIAQQDGVRVYEVFGMDCPGCHGGLEKLVKKIPAVQEAQANWQQQRLTVAVRPGSELNDDAIYDAIRRANFTPGERIR